MIKRITVLAVLSFVLAGAAHAGKVANWTAIQSFTSEAKVCEITSLDTTGKINVEFEVTDIRDVQLRMINMSGPGATLPTGKVSVRIDDHDVLTGTGSHDDIALSVKLSPQQLKDFFEAAKTSQRMTITLGDGTSSEYVMQAGMINAYIEMGQCLGAMTKAAR